MTPKRVIAGSAAPSSCQGLAVAGEQGVEEAPPAVVGQRPEHPSVAVVTLVRRRSVADDR